jgi:predicted nuclease of predicted toxin-antitoxin system
MRFKVDENLHPDIADRLRQCAHDAETVHEEGLRGSSDGAIASTCRQEGRCLV